MKKLSLRSVCKLLPGYDPFENAGDCVFDEDAAKLALDFFSEHLCFIEGDKAGEPFNLELWQQSITANLFGWKRPDGTRRYRESFIFVPRKNGKTPFTAGIVNYCAFCDGEPGAQIYSAAAEKEQASLIFRHASGMINRNPELKQRCRIYRTYKSIEFYQGDTIYKALSADADTKHGLNAHLVIVDELHAQPNRDLVDVLVTSSASRRQPLIVYITTAGFDKHSICFEKYDYAVKVRDGVIEDRYFLPVIYESLAEDDWQDEKIWAKANPNIGISVSIDYLRRECKRAQDSPAYENTFRRLHLNQWTEQDVRWLNIDRWNACAGDVKLDELTGLQCYGALDLGATSDLTALVLLFCEGGRWRLLPFFWVPEDTVKRRTQKDRVPYDVWVKRGYMKTTPGNTTDYDFIRKDINELGDKYGIKKLAIDRLFQGAQLSNQLITDGFDVVSFNQSFLAMAAPTKAFDELVLSGKLEHGNHPVLNWMAHNVAVETDVNGNIKPSKKKSYEKIDGIVCCVMDVGLAGMEQSTKSVYEERGILTI